MDEADEGEEEGGEPPLTGAAVVGVTTAVAAVGAVTGGPVASVVGTMPSMPLVDARFDLGFFTGDWPVFVVDVGELELFDALDDTSSDKDEE